MSTTQVTLRCGACGSDQFRRPDKPKSEDKVTCMGCGATSTFGEVMESAKTQVMDKIKAAFKGFK